MFECIKEELVKEKKEKKKGGDSSLFKDLLVAAIRHDKIGTPGSLKKHFLHVQSVVPPIQGKPSTFSSSLSLNNFNILKYISKNFEKKKKFP